MGIFNRRKKEENEFHIDEVTTRLDVLQAEKELMKDLADEAERDIKNLMIKEDMIDEEMIEMIPVIKKYSGKLDNLMQLAYKSAEIEIVKYERLEDAIVKLAEDQKLLRTEIKETNKNLERIAKALEKK